MAVVYVPSEDLMCVDDYGYIFPYRKLFVDFMVPEMTPTHFKANSLENDFHSCIQSSKDIGSPMYRLRRHICNFHLFGKVKPQRFPRELLVSSARRASRSRKERDAKNYLAKCIRSVLSELSHVVVDDEVESAIKYGELMTATIRQVLLLNPTLEEEEDGRIVKDAIFKRVGTLIRSYRRRFPDVPKVQLKTVSRRSEAETDDGPSQEVPEVNLVDG